MFGWTLLDALLGVDAESLLEGADFSSTDTDVDNDEREGELVPTDYAESRQAHRRI